ncbi:MAG: histidinol-phosphate transaminase [Proteobacteria bacterium]|nr:MAG: histidinol-phosphate transaminase [Pseudomonadota bacterium]
MSLAKRVKPWVASLNPYQPGKPIEELERELGLSGVIKLASNENPLGPSPRAIEAVQRLLGDLHRYPDGASFALRSKLSERLGVAPDQLVFGCGADEILELVAKAFLGPGDEAVFAWPSFAMYPIVAQGMGATPVAVPLDADLVHDLGAMADAVNERTRVVVVCNPNNPTGTSVGAAAFERFAARLPDDVVLVVDEAYVDFARRPDFPDSIAWVRRRPGTLVARTFSKIAGLAGLRVGYGIADPELTGYLERARHPFNVNLLAEAAAVAALDDREHLERTVRMNGEGVDRLRRELGAMGIETWPSEANFVLAKAWPGVYDQLLREGIIVRPLAGFGMPGHIRITVGLPEEIERLLKAMRRLVEEGAR